MHTIALAAGKPNTRNTQSGMAATVCAGVSRDVHARMSRDNIKHEATRTTRGRTTGKQMRWLSGLKAQEACHLADRPDSLCVGAAAQDDEGPGVKQKKKTSQYFVHLVDAGSIRKYLGMSSAVSKTVRLVRRAATAGTTQPNTQPLTASCSVGSSTAETGKTPAADADASMQAVSRPPRESTVRLHCRDMADHFLPPQAPVVRDGDVEVVHSFRRVPSAAEPPEVLTRRARRRRTTSLRKARKVA